MGNLPPALLETDSETEDEEWEPPKQLPIDVNNRVNTSKLYPETKGFNLNHHDDDEKNDEEKSDNEIILDNSKLCSIMLSHSSDSLGGCQASIGAVSSMGSNSVIPEGTIRQVHSAAVTNKAIANDTQIHYNIVHKTLYNDG